MDKDALYYHFANLGLVLIGLLSIQAVLGGSVIILLPGIITGFFISWRIKDSRPQHMDTFTGLLSLAAAVVILGRLYDTAISFENLLKIFSTTLVWLTLFQSFGLKTGRSYALLQFISVCLLISSASLALEQEVFYVTALAVFLFIFIFTLRLNLVCERKRKGSLIIGDQQNIMGLWQQIKVVALMFSFVMIAASFTYPLVPRFDNLSLGWIPSTLLGAPDNVPVMRLFTHAPKSLKDSIKEKEEQRVDDLSKKRETSEDYIKRKEPEPAAAAEAIKRFTAREFNKDIDLFEISSLEISSDKEEVPAGDKLRLYAKLIMSDGSIIPAAKLVDWKVKSSISPAIDAEGYFVSKEEGMAQISASYMGNFSNDIYIKITKPVAAPSRRSWAYYLGIILLSLCILLFIILPLLLLAWMFIKSRRLMRLAFSNPREFIKDVYIRLCKAFRFYGVPWFDYLAHREFYDSVKSAMPLESEPMHLLTENVLEARFSTHVISIQHSKKALELCGDVRKAVLERSEHNEFWKKALFRLFLLDISMLARMD